MIVGSGLYTGGVRGGSDEPPFFGQVADIRLQLTCFTAKASNNAAFPITHTGYAIDMHSISITINNIVFAYQCSSKNCY